MPIKPVLNRIEHNTKLLMYCRSQSNFISENKPWAGTYKKMGVPYSIYKLNARIKKNWTENSLLLLIKYNGLRRGLQYVNIINTLILLC